jgi:signal transduction histidine kinase
MLGTGSAVRKRLFAVAFTFYGLIMLGLMLLMPGEETIPFHFIFLGLTVVYGYALWNRNTALALIGAVTVSTGFILVMYAREGLVGWEECTESFFMPAIFLGTMWHSRRRLQVQQRVEARAGETQIELDRERQFMQDAAHALRTPMTIARGHLDLARASLTDPDIVDDLDVVVEQLDRLKYLATMLVTLDRIASETDELREPTDLALLVSQMRHRWAKSADRRWELVTLREPAVSLVDTHLVEMALDAVIENAVKHTDDGDVIRLTVDRSARFVFVRVDDNGPGVPPDEREVVFRRFARGKAAQKHSGSGLGLPLVRAVAESHGGAASFVDSPLGGAGMVMTFPAVDLPEVSQPRTARSVLTTAHSARTA